MNDDNSSNGASQKTWLERLSQVLLGEPRDREQLIHILRDAQQRELFDSDALAMIEGVLQVSEMQVRDIMIPRSQMVVVDRDVPLEQFLPSVVESAHSRFPVIGDSKDEIVGILLAKDLLNYFINGNREHFNIRDVLRPVVFIPESKRLNVLLKEFRASRNHMAIVVDEYGGVAGLVTIEDVLEQIVGEIIDEVDVVEEGFIKKHSDTRFIIKALMPIEDFNEYFQHQFRDDEFDTLAGLLMNKFGHLPKRGESIVIDRFNFEILHADNRRIHLIEATLIPINEETEEVPSQQETG